MTSRIPAILGGLALAVTACTSGGTATSTASTTDGSAQCPTEGEEFETAMLFVEHNATDADTGVHGNFGGEAWTELCIWNPDGELVLSVRPEGPLGNLGIADLFFESREPPNDERSIEDLLATFPEGDYLVGGNGFDGTARAATATFTHDIPAEPVITAPHLAADEEEAAEVVADPADFVVSWEPVTVTLSGDPVDITGYEVIITKVDHDDPNGFSRPVYDVHLAPDAPSLTVPEEFFEPATLYELEVLALEVSGNQTISLGFFTTR
jgi:hypothetical protein